MEIKKKKIVIIGLGKTGYDTSIFLLKRGAKVFITELNKSEKIIEKADTLTYMGAAVELGKHTKKFIEGADIIIPSPGIPEENPIFEFIKEKGIKVISEIELGYIYSRSKKIITITGTDGKTTTASLLGLMFKNSKLPFILCGNIGNSFIGEIDKIKEDTFVILEASSFQLEKIKTFCPFIGCLLNIGEDHLDRHFSFKNYLRAKEKVFQNQTEEDYAILNYDDPNCRKIGSQLEAKTLFFSQKKKLDKGIYKEGNKIILNLETEKLIFTTDKVKLTGKGNYENMMTSILSGFICKIEPDIIQKTLNEFLPLPHRFEKVGEKKGVVYINDSKSTNPHSVINALKSIEKKSKVILIMGGQYKQVSFKKLIPLIKKQVKLLILFGTAKEIIANEIKESKIPYLFVNNLKEAVQLGAAKAETGETVLFSPACSSFDMFKNYMERGNVFKEEVTLLS